MHRLRVQLAFALGIPLAGCLSTRLAHIENLEVPLPQVAPGTSWQAETSALIERYESAPVLAPDDERLDPLYGGLSTLSYFGADAKPRVADQLLPEGSGVQGHPLEAACAPGGAPDPGSTLATIGVPAFTPLWVPLAKAGEEPAASWRCSETGVPAAADSFCLFARLALQPRAAGPLVLVVHGMFDSGAQAYVQRMAAVLYRRGYSVLIPDMRDHGDTLRSAPELATTLGTLEGPDLLALVAGVRRACGERVGRVGIVGVSAGGLDAIRAFTLDRTNSLDGGVIALSPLLDVPATIERLTETEPCPLTRSIELSWLDDLAIATASGAAFFGGAATLQALEGERLGAETLWTAGIGAGVGLVGALVLDTLLDGGSEPCVSEHAIANIVQDALRVRWRALQTRAPGQTMSAAGRLIEPRAIDIDRYLRERARHRAVPLRATVGAYRPEDLARDLRSALRSDRAGARLLVLGAADDPLTRVDALEAFIERTTAIPQVYARVLQHGGHGAMWIVQPTVTEEIVARFFAE